MGLSQSYFRPDVKVGQMTCLYCSKVFKADEYGFTGHMRAHLKEFTWDEIREMRRKLFPIKEKHGTKRT